MTPDTAQRTARFNRLRALFMRWRSTRHLAPAPKVAAPKPAPVRRGIATPERLARIRDLTQEGVTRAQLIKAYGYQAWVIQEAEDRYGFTAITGRKGRQKGSSLYDTQAILSTLAEVGGNCAEAARRLGLNRRTVWAIQRRARA